VGGRVDVLDTRSTADGESGVQANTGVFSPKTGFLLRVTPSVGAYANVSRGFRVADGEVGDPTLPVITAWAYECGLRYDRNGVIASAALFRMNVNNEQTFDPIARGSSSGGSSRRQGLEVEWNVPVAGGVSTSGQWTFNDARYTHQVIASEGSEEPPAIVDGLRVYNTAQYVGAAALEVAPGGRRWRLHVSGNWVGPYSPFDRPGDVLGGYGLLHLMLSARVARGVDVDVGVRNVLDRAYPELVAGRLVAPGQPRALSISARKMF
jgi:outer membrane receptor protein involved in Fe transport